MVKSISAKIKDACYQVYESTNITEQPEYQKRNIRHHSRIADTFFSLLLELFDMVLCCFPFFMQSFLYRTHENHQLLICFFHYTTISTKFQYEERGFLKLNSVGFILGIS